MNLITTIETARQRQAELRALGIEGKLVAYDELQQTKNVLMHLLHELELLVGKP